MTYIIVTGKDTIVGHRYQSYTGALTQAERLFGTDAVRWMDLNIRVEENR